MVGTHRDAEFEVFWILQQIATVCNSLQQIVTTTGSKGPSQTAKNLVVGHKCKQSSENVVFWT